MKSRKGFTSVTVHVTATVSVALVLLLLGIVATLGFAARSITTDIKEHLGFDITLKETVTADQINAFKRTFATAPYVASFKYHSPEEAMATWQTEMGEDLVQLLEVNPFLPEFEINLRANYACADSLDAIVLPLQKNEQVQEVSVHTEVVDSVNRNISTMMLVLIVAVCALTPISFVLINNTVRLTIYSHRFTIHTMKLVGASRGFIRRPFVLSNLLQGIIAAIVGSALLAGMASYVFTLDPTLQAYVGWPQLAVVFGGMLVVGILLCLLAAWFATQRYLTRSYDELFN